MRFEKEIPYPKTIYKYSRITEFLFQHLTNAELWFSNPQDFNDPYDCNVGFNQRKYTEEEIRGFWKLEIKDSEGNQIADDKKEQRINEWLADQSLIDKFLSKPIRDLLQEKGVTCFTTKNDSILMWSHYADSHKGVCIGYSPEILKKTFYQHEWVTYGKEFPSTNMLNMSTFIGTTMCFKSDSWEYEDEIRFFQKYKGSYSFPKEAVKEVIFGLNSQLTQMHSIMNLMLQLGYKDVIYKQVVLRNNEFRIQFADLKFEPKLNAVLKIGLTEDSKKINFSILNPRWEAEKTREKRKLAVAGEQANAKKVSNKK